MYVSSKNTRQGTVILYFKQKKNPYLCKKVFHKKLLDYNYLERKSIYEENTDLAHNNINVYMCRKSFAGSWPNRVGPLPFAIKTNCVPFLPAAL